MNELIKAQGGVIRPQMELTGALYSRFIAYLDASPKTIETYTRTLRQFFSWLQWNRIARPEREDILTYRAYLKESGKKPTTVQNYITVVRIFFGWTEQEGLYPNIAAHVKGAKLDKEHKKDYLTSGQVKAVLSQIDRTTAAGKRDYAIMVLMVTGGLRTIEVARANIGDLRTAGDSPVLYLQGKGHEEKTDYVKLAPQVEAAIREYLRTRTNTEAEAPLFTSQSNNSKGQRMTTRAISGVAKERITAAGYVSDRLTAHSLRHTAVTLSLLSGRSLEEVQQFARHSNISTTMIYNHALDKAQNGCAAAVASSIF